MILLLDTHAALWWWTRSRKLTPSVIAAITQEENKIFFSTISAYEINAKFKLGKLPEAEPFVHHLDALIADSGFKVLELSLIHARAAGLLPGPHRDPFDRLLIAQAQTEKAHIVSADPVFAAYGAATVW
ncbi:MAG: type II toxin-antitoxin system VapC family toxin [Rhodospirillaceae bacterium]|nr:type II toxin-antitoxin system VapC family toxin [Rhodospirillaceae bacterium]